MIIQKLQILKQRGGSEDYIYAINANLEFYESTKSVWGYILWLVQKAPKLDGSRLLEINDLLPEYDTEMHHRLISMERKKFPGLINLIVGAVTRFIFSTKRDLIVMNAGSGGMELERQVIDNLLKSNHQHKVIFIAVDQSETAHQIAKENLFSLQSVVDLYRTDSVTLDFIREKEKLATRKQYTIIQCKNDIFFLNKSFLSKDFDLTYNSLFMHHLSDEQAKKVQMMSLSMGENYFEYDGYKDLKNTIPQSIIGWFNPVFLNAQIFSNLRFATKEKTLLRNNEGINKLFFSKLGYYLLNYAGS